MGARLFALTYFSVFALLHFIDAGLNYALLIQSEGSHFYVDKDLLSYLFEPVNIMMVVVSTAMIYKMESDHKRAASLVNSGWMALLCTPLVFLGMKAISAINSFLIYVGYEYSFLGKQFFVDSGTPSVIISFVVLAVIFSIPASIYLRKRYLFRI
ncbi:hypothetical protein [Pseudohongiella spirulinae]|uniref:Uncharacterized protein n=1 Tax=Pseudohongiella spirulinae TaxID=1249552 RepID=A0A0S2KAZ2_9GAMM|nr:hypothetical protein [Pseudohongiella spirulinae]ALO45495.1 hypothetical protein PS2015_821 [Pseudohongiella spirulinae]